MKKPRILIVDDEMDMLRLLSRVVGADIACEIETISNASTALEVFRQRSFDLVCLLQKGIEPSFLLRENQQLQQRIRKGEAFQFIGASQKEVTHFFTADLSSGALVQAQISGSKR
jgi:CheY-like chemotaxis protein